MAPILQTVADWYAFRIQPDSDEPIVSFLEMAFRALTDEGWTAEHLAYGKQELPLVIEALGSEFSLEFSPEFGGGPTTVLNPAAVVPTLVPPDLRASVLPPTAGWAHAHATAAVPVLAVLHGVFKHPTTGDRALVLINWTHAAAFFGGRFNPWLYWLDQGAFSAEFSAEFATTAPYRIDRLNQDGTTTVIATALDRHSNLLCSGTSGTISGQDVSLGAVPAYSIQAYRFRQE
jgi:hypothetical protein